MGYKENYQIWLEDPYFDAQTKAQLKEIAADDKEIEERFYKDLEFGTAGLRGILGAGTNRMNVYTVRKATQGLANYIISQNKQSKGVAIAFDSRHMSPEFADESARTLAANGIKAYVFDALRPTPELSFAVRYLGCAAGINITASHNPPEYNGYKVYWEDGAQITPPHDQGIMEEVKKITDYAAAKTMPYYEAKQAGLYEVIGKKIDDAYNEELKKLVLNQDAIRRMQKEIKIVYSPLHGTGNLPVRRVLKELGFENVYVVKEQEMPDGNFPTVSYPNPESKEAFVLGEKLAKEVDADLILATDPDADRLGVYVKDKDGEYHVLTGNMSGTLIAQYLISEKAKRGLIEDGAAIIKSIVTTNMVDEVAKYYNVRLIEVLTGFKYIGRQILEFETKKNGSYLFGLEESYGCLPGDYARDKDAVAATMVLCEAAAYYQTQGKTLWDVMLMMYERYGYYKDSVTSITLAGKEGIEKIQFIIEELEKNSPTQIGAYQVEKVRNYRTGKSVCALTGEVTPTNLPISNVLYYELSDGAWVCVRPSGTEPKLKLYYGVKGKNFEDAEKQGAFLEKSLNEIVEHYL
ncbi:phospho-sugar mutase [Eubacterium oxidoreducens]|uniref:Phosphoglucomutase n=1 Tax=Eubacterium oxidoreducens TaxID=1732 RepID=A0A1G6BWL9_EUBOX|nr:phospho-sugar mutase [Eubacterium oxidoreducens]SDB24988.1 phosphoglucomutase [Eubacterium oxidoreducens]